MNKKTMMEYYKKTEMEWTSLPPKKKAKKIAKCLYELREGETDEKKLKYIDDQLIVIEELDPKEIEEHLDMIHSVIMEKALENIKNADK